MAPPLSGRGDFFWEPKPVLTSIKGRLKETTTRLFKGEVRIEFLLEKRVIRE